MIVPITEQNILEAAAVHAASWRASHTFCAPQFTARHTTERQAQYLRGELEKGKALWLLLDPEPVGLVSVWKDLIENLYVLPEKQRRGYGRRLLHFAMAQCQRPALWVLSSNQAAYNWYIKEGFIRTGVEKSLSDTLSEVEMVFLEERDEA